MLSICLTFFKNSILVSDFHKLAYPNLSYESYIWKSDKI